MGLGLLGWVASWRAWAGRAGGGPEKFWAKGASKDSERPWRPRRILQHLRLQRSGFSDVPYAEHAKSVAVVLNTSAT